MRVMLASSRGIILLQCTVQCLWNITWICTSRARHSPHMRTLAIEFSNFIQHLNHINICDRSHNYVRASLYLAIYTVECNKRTPGPAERNGWNIYENEKNP